jgi:hypothetical protein
MRAEPSVADVVPALPGRGLRERLPGKCSAIVGIGNLSVSSIVTGNAHVTVSQDTAYIAPGTNRLIVVSYDGNQAPGMPYNLNISINSNAQEYPLLYIAVAIE